MEGEKDRQPRNDRRISKGLATTEIPQRDAKIARKAWEDSIVFDFSFDRSMPELIFVKAI